MWYPPLGVTENDWLAPWFTLTLPLGEIDPPAEAEAAMVYALIEK
jgi:hypothetical protein